MFKLENLKKVLAFTTVFFLVFSAGPYQVVAVQGGNGGGGGNEKIDICHVDPDTGFAQVQKIDPNAWMDPHGGDKHPDDFRIPEDGTNQDCEDLNDPVTPTTGTLVIQKDVVDEEGNDVVDNNTFTVTVDGDNAEFSENTDAIFSDLEPGTYEVVEGVISGYEQVSINDGDPVVVVAGETTTITIVNEVVIATPPIDLCSNIDGDQETMPNGKELVDGLCVDIVIPPTCPEGTHLEGETCVQDGIEQGDCDPGFHLDGETCVPDEVIPPTCPEGTHLDGDNCVQDEEEFTEKVCHFEQDEENSNLWVASIVNSINAWNGHSNHVDQEGRPVGANDFQILNQDQENSCVNYNVNNEEEEDPITCEEGVELIKNGSFETPAVEHASKWNIFTALSTMWNSEWRGDIASTFDEASRPDANLEFHRGVNGWLPKDGEQYAELDGDWFGPDSGPSGEPGSSVISQTIETLPGYDYALTFSFSPRPNTGAENNILEVLWGDESVATTSRAGGEQTDWSDHEYTLSSGDEESMKLAFADLGSADGLGTFVDNVSLKCVGQTEEEETPVCEQGFHWDSESTQCVPNPIIVDRCLNIAEIQTTIPEGYHLVGDSECVANEDNDEDNGGNGGGGSSSGGHGRSRSSSTGGSTGEVLGAFTSNCVALINSYLKMGLANDPEQVKNLQSFLNEQGVEVPVTGFFGIITDNAVKNFQKAHKAETLAPWKAFGLSDGETPTGYVFKTTKFTINNMVCPGVETAPILP